MTVKAKATFVLAFLVFANAAAWGARELFAALLDPVSRALGA